MNELFDQVSRFLTKRPGLLPLVGMLIIFINLILHIIIGAGVWLTDSHLLLHIGLLIAIFGLLLVKPLQ